VAQQRHDLEKIAVWRPLPQQGVGAVSRPRAEGTEAGIPRREVLRRVAVVMGVSLSAPAVLGVLNGRAAHAAAAAPAQFLDEDQFALLAEITEIMIPRTDTPGARDVGVPAFIDDMLANVYSGDAQQRFLDGLEAFQAEVRERTGRALLELAPEQRHAEVQQAHDAARALDAPAGERPFMLLTKELALLGYFTSEAGATQVLQYEAVPGDWQACVPLAEAGNGRTWATDKPLPF